MPSPGPKPTDDVPFERFPGPSINAPAPPITNTPNTNAIHLGLAIAAADLQQRLYFLPLPHGHGSFGPILEPALKIQHSSPDNHHQRARKPALATSPFHTARRSTYFSSIVYTLTDYDSTPIPHFAPASAKILINSPRDCNIVNQITLVPHITIRAPIPLPRSPSSRDGTDRNTHVLSIGPCSERRAGAVLVDRRGKPTDGCHRQAQLI